MNNLWLVISLILVILILLFALLLCVLIPLIISRSPYLLRRTLFTTGGASKDSNYYDENTKLGVRNLYVTFPSNSSKEITIGIYHYLPMDYVLNQTDGIPLDEYDDLLLNSSYNVLLLFHGRGQSRASFGAKYSILSKLFHVMVFDYRCFGDSSNAELTEEGLVGDCVSLYKWLQNKTHSSIYVWGQSLGSALCIETVYFLNKESIVPKGMFLESSFTNIREAISESPIGKFFSWIPWFNLILDGYKRNGFLFSSSEHLKEIKCPVMVMHSADDQVIPFRQGIKLYEVVMRRKIKVNIAKFLPISARYKCGHDFIYKFPNFTSQIVDFIDVCDKEFDSNATGI